MLVDSRIASLLLTAASMLSSGTQRVDVAPIIPEVNRTSAVRSLSSDLSNYRPALSFAPRTSKSTAVGFIQRQFKSSKNDYVITNSYHSKNTTLAKQTTSTNKLVTRQTNDWNGQTNRLASPVKTLNTFASHIKQSFDTDKVISSQDTTSSTGQSYLIKNAEFAEQDNVPCHNHIFNSMNVHSCTYLAILRVHGVNSIFRSCIGR
jgi:hypothetical protein